MNTDHSPLDNVFNQEVMEVVLEMVEKVCYRDAKRKHDVYIPRGAKHPDPTKDLSYTAKLAYDRQRASNRQVSNVIDLVDEINWRSSDLRIMLVVCKDNHDVALHGSKTLISALKETDFKSRITPEERFLKYSISLPLIEDKSFSELMRMEAREIQTLSVDRKRMFSIYTNSHAFTDKSTSESRGRTEEWSPLLPYKSLFFNEKPANFRTYAMAAIHQILYGQAHNKVVERIALDPNHHKTLMENTLTDRVVLHDKINCDDDHNFYQEDLFNEGYDDVTDAECPPAHEDQVVETSPNEENDNKALVVSRAPTKKQQISPAKDKPIIPMKYPVKICQQPTTHLFPVKTISNPSKNAREMKRTTQPGPPPAFMLPVKTIKLSDQEIGSYGLNNSGNEPHHPGAPYKMRPMKMRIPMKLSSAQTSLHTSAGREGSSIHRPAPYCSPSSKAYRMKRAQLDIPLYEYHDDDLEHRVMHKAVVESSADLYGIKKISQLPSLESSSKKSDLNRAENRIFTDNNFQPLSSIARSREVIPRKAKRSRLDIPDSYDSDDDDNMESNDGLYGFKQRDANGGLPFLAQTSSKSNLDETASKREYDEEPCLYVDAEYPLINPVAHSSADELYDVNKKVEILNAKWRENVLKLKEEEEQNDNGFSHKSKRFVSIRSSIESVPQQIHSMKNLTSDVSDTRHSDYSIPDTQHPSKSYKYKKGNL